MTTTTTTDAEDYSRTIAEEVIALDTILAGAPYGFDPSNIDPDDEEHAAYLDAIRTLEMEHVTDPDEIPDVWLNETALDVAILADTRGPEFGARIEILRTAGGPHCQIDRDTNNSTVVEVVTHWGTDHYTHRMNVERFTAWIDELAAY